DARSIGACRRGWNVIPIQAQENLVAKSKKPSGKRKSPKPELASPPPDNPLLRHEEMDLDRFSPETIATVAETLAAAMAVPGEGKKSRPPRGAAPSAAAILGGEMTQSARQPLAALQHG